MKSTLACFVAGVSLVVSMGASTAGAAGPTTVPDCTGFVQFFSTGSPPNESVRKRRDQMLPNYLLGCMTISANNASCGNYFTPDFGVLVAMHSNLGPSPHCQWTCQLNTGTQTMCRQTIDANCSLPVELMYFGAE